MAHKIEITLSSAGVKQAIREIEAYKEWVNEKTKLLIEKLALLGAQEAAIRFASAQYDGINDSSISVEPTTNGWRIIASGEAVCFIEFGSGVYHNSSEPYPNPPGRPNGVSNIGEYGHGRGKRQGWVYDGNPGTNGKVLSNGKVLTRGNPAAMPMWFAEQEIIARVAEMAREVFAT